MHRGIALSRQNPSSKSQSQSNPPEALRGGIHTVDEILSPANDLQDNGNSVMLVNPDQNPPLRMTLRNEVTPNNMPHPDDDALFPNSPQTFLILIVLHYQCKEDKVMVKMKGIHLEGMAMMGKEEDMTKTPMTGTSPDEGTMTGQTLMMMKTMTKEMVLGQPTEALPPVQK